MKKLYRLKGCCFEAINLRNKYKSDLDIFIRESKLEDFFGENRETFLFHNSQSERARV
jgi:ATP-dependent DNA helicase RecQ